jgi:hypothetical protein
MYGLWDSTYATDHGYEPPNAPDPNQAIGPVRFTGDGIGVYLGQVNTYQGQPVPAGGCQAAEIEPLVGDAPPGTDYDYVDNLQQEAFARATQDSRVTALMATWQTCMANAGWTYADVMAPFAYWSTRRGTDKFQPVVSEQEKKAARDDLACKKSTALLGTWLAADIAYQNALIAREGDRLTGFQALLRQETTRANAVIAAG